MVYQEYIKCACAFAIHFKSMLTIAHLHKFLMKLISIWGRNDKRRTGYFERWLFWIFKFHKV